MSLFSLGNRSKKLGNRPQYMDVHSHVSFSEYNQDRSAVVDRMRNSGTNTITVGTCLESSERAVEIANQYDGMYATIGLHPTDVREERFNPDDYEDLVQNIEVVGIGECGLDYFRLEGTEEENTKEKERQKKDFQAQIEFAVKHDLPLMIHARISSKTSMDAYEDCISILKLYKSQYKEKLRGNIHFFTGTVDIAKQFVAIDFTISFTGVLTFADDYDDVVREIPLDMILTETDSPYATPVPNRGKRNEPVYVQAVVKRIAEIKKLPEPEVAKTVVENAYRVFAIPD